MQILTKHSFPYVLLTFEAIVNEDNRLKNLKLDLNR